MILSGIRFVADIVGRWLAISKGSGLYLVADSPIVIKGSAGVLRHYRVYTDGVNNATVTLYDNAITSSGKILDKFPVKGEDLVGGANGVDVEAEDGITMKIEGTGASAIAFYL